ncbi:ribosome biogenesis GTPase RsgA [Thalassoporum mexicanum PCC 7367]|uniref:ribosome small subunit-dependent GTPase A n=1 Tax=Thalassoporum mexicanum TaxID=3457544 RepID=UPI00029F8DA5|nr:ribosome small subunit-dependent GTPase A [Pseudanabaena sp. PCC 7367]AFY71115.1 ribosome biogenesis GTPase RsgA [Pseudanabaena sp. PCC 7367]
MSKPKTSKTLVGTVLAVQANFYRVSLLGEQDKATGLDLELLCIRRSRLKKIGQRVCVGDRVVVESPDWQGQRGAIGQVLSRRNLLARPPIANVDRALLMFALSDPEPDAYQLSRFLVNIEAQGLEICLALNKSDLVSPEFTQTWCDRLKSWGYAPIVISTSQQTNIEQLRRSLTQGITVVSGPSGVGKSSLINLLIPDLELRTAQVSARSGHGRHTTRHVELFDLNDCNHNLNLNLNLTPANPNHSHRDQPLPQQPSLIADTPGFTQPAIACSSIQLANCFPEIRAKLDHAPCQFNDCLHQAEPGCVVRGDWERYDHYCLLLAEILTQEAKQQAIANPDQSIKEMSGVGGQAQTEPRLQQKKYRRTSRRRQQQELEDLYQEELEER